MFREKYTKQKSIAPPARGGVIANGKKWLMK
jgi:hypothetical protein